MYTKLIFNSITYLLQLRNVYSKNAMKTQSGPITSNSQIILFVVLCLVMAVLLYLTLHVEQPYLWIVDYRYKSNYYQDFVLPDGYDIETQGRVWSNWDTDENGIQKICDLFNNSAGAINDRFNLKSSKQALSLWEAWIVAFLDALEHTDVINPEFQGFPWGNNWYQFTISAPTNLAYYIVSKESSGAIKTVAAKAIQYLIKDPEHSLGYERDKANSAMMLFPWTLSHMITGTLDKTNPSYLYAIDQYDLRPNMKLRANEDGVHIDYSYLTHNGVYAFGYLDSINAIYPDTMQVIPEVSQLDLDYHIDQIHSKLYHPSIPLSGSTLFHRRQERKCSLYTGKTKTPKAVIVPTMRYIRVFTEDYQWSIRLGQVTVAYYECDQMVYNMGLYSCLCKQAFYKDDDPSIAPFPATGFLYLRGQKELTEVDPNPTGKPNATTQPYYSKVSTQAFSYTMLDYDENVAYFYVLNIFYEPLLTDHFDESGYIDIANDKLYYWFNMEHGRFSRYNFYWVDQEIHLEDIDRTGVSSNLTEFEYDLKNRTGEARKTTTNWGHGAPFIGDVNGKYKFWVHGNTDFNSYNTAVAPEDKYTIVFKNDKPLIYSPAETDVLAETISGVANGVTYKFKWHHNWNQYVWEDYVMENPNPM